MHTCSGPSDGHRGVSARLKVSCEKHNENACMLRLGLSSYLNHVRSMSARRYLAVHKLMNVDTASGSSHVLLAEPKIFSSCYIWCSGF